jgi:hypothetical protein
MAPPRRGGLRTPAREGVRPARTSPPLDHRLIVNVPVRMQCLGLSPALPGGRTECVPPRKPPPRNLRVSPVRPCVLGSPPVEGRAPHARKGRRHTSPNVASSRPPAHRKRTGENAMPRLESGLARRTHGVRPSEKTAVRVISGLFPARPSHPG